MILLCRIFQVCIIIQTANLDLTVAQVFHVTEFTSSVNLSNRKFACENEEVVYRCVTVSTMENEFFYTEWTWINGSKQWQVGQFDSEQRIGNYTCRSYQKFLHSTLVSTNSTTCVSLLIVIPSLLQSHDRDINVIINCSAYGPDQQSLLHNQTLSHNYILSDTPQWDDRIINNVKDNINVNSNNCFKTATGDTIFLLKISWPNISNAEHIDFDFYTLQINAGGESFTIRTTATSYEHVLYIRTQEVSNLDANITIDAVNRCNGTSNDPLQVSYTLNKDKCAEKSHGCRNDVSSYAIVLSLAGLIVDYIIMYG